MTKAELQRKKGALEALMGSPRSTPDRTRKVTIEVSEAYEWRLKELLALLESPRYSVPGDHLVTLARSAFHRRIWAMEKRTE